MKVVLKMPRLSMNMEEATVIVWHKTIGQKFDKGEPLYDVETEKVASEVEAPCNGILTRIIAEVDASVEVGDPVCEIET